MSIQELHLRFRELLCQLDEIAEEQQSSPPVTETTTVGGITATRDKHTALGLILDFCGEDIERAFEEIR